MSESKKRTYSSEVCTLSPLRLEETQIQTRKETQPQRQCLTSRPPRRDSQPEDLLMRLIEAIKAL